MPQSFYLFQAAGLQSRIGILWGKAIGRGFPTGRNMV